MLTVYFHKIMSNKCGKFSPECESFQERDVENLKLLYRNTGNPEKDKSSRVSSDEETTSSSLIPIPDTLTQMRNDLKTTFCHGVDPSEAESSFETYGVLEESKGKISTSLEELRRKYTLKNETSVVLKMNSANLMLDDILKSNNLKIEENTQPHFDREEDFKTKTVYETETSSTVSTVKRSTHVPILPNVLYATPPVLCAHHCSTSCRQPDRNYSPVCTRTCSLEKGAQVSGENQKKKSLMERLQALQLKYKFHSVYKVMQKNNPFNKDRKQSEIPGIQQGIPGATRLEDHAAPEDPVSCKCNSNKFFANPCNKQRMVFDLIESSDTSQCDVKSLQRVERPCMYPTGPFGKECKCPEVMARCICHDCTCNTWDKNSESHEKPEVCSSLSYPKKSNEYVQTEDATPLNVPFKEQESSPTPQKECRGTKINAVKGPTTPIRDWRMPHTGLVERTDIYYFDHGNSAYYRTTDNHPIRYTECIVERTDEYATKFWAEFFGTLGIGLAFFTSFILQLYRFFFTSIIRTLTVGFLQIFTDYFFKPFLAIIFNGLIQPCLILAYNIATSLRDLFLPISQIFGFFGKEVTNIFKSVRLIEINNDKCRQSSCYCGNKV